MKKSLSVVIPFYNEHENLPLLYTELQRVFETLADRYDIECIFVNDGSTDGSDSVIQSISEKDPRIKIIEFSRNFGKELALSAGIAHSSGEAVLMLDADLQHPPSLISDFVAKWENGVEVVIGVRKTTERLPLLKRWGSALYYKISNAISKNNPLPNSTDYRLIDKKVAREFIRFTETNRITRGLIDWLGFKREVIYFHSPARSHGDAQQKICKMLSTKISV
ncbi:MAG: glycosyltransferase family 2 protein [Candidatus Kerfeldbacteria bacterium]|nr:glycosyltransferase family 2 protein [Candidatus Kerfeldbacteria bacterium]